MIYTQISLTDIPNGEGMDISLFVQDYPRNYKGRFCGGKQWTSDEFDKFIALAGRPFVRRISILGGEPLCSQNCSSVFFLCKKLKDKYSNKPIWIYSGYTYEELQDSRSQFKPLFFADVLVDGRYEDDKRDLTLAFRGSKNQRIIDLKKTFSQGQVVLYNPNIL